MVETCWRWLRYCQIRVFFGISKDSTSWLHRRCLPTTYPIIQWWIQLISASIGALISMSTSVRTLIWTRLNGRTFLRLQAAMEAISTGCMVYFPNLMLPFATTSLHTATPRECSGFTLITSRCADLLLSSSNPHQTLHSHAFCVLDSSVQSY